MATMPALADSPVGVFDSGLGGLSVTKEIRKRLPNEDLIYFADSAYCPYGIRSPEEIRARSELMVRGLIDAGAKVVVVACNTASAMAVFSLREVFPDVPLIGLEPAVKPAVAITRTGKVGVLATPRTVAGERLQWLIETYAGGIEVRRVAATGLVELVEQGIVEGPEVDATLRPLLDPMMEVGVDMVVLGCTHYPFLRDAIQRYVGPEVGVIDSGEAIARRLDVVLSERSLHRESPDRGAVTFATSGVSNDVEAIATRLLGEPIAVVRTIDELGADRAPSSTLLSHPAT